MAKRSSLKFAVLESGPKAYGYGPGVHTSTYPLSLGGTLKPKSTVHEGGPGSGRLPEDESRSGGSEEKPKPKLIARWTYSGDRYKAGVRYPKPDKSGSTDKKKNETDSGSSFPGQLRAKESSKRKIGSLVSQVHFKEATGNQDGSRFRVILIEEGLGNLKDCFYYSKEALQSAVSLFEGKKAFADHPSRIEEESRPERSTRDILGYYENLEFAESDARGQLIADLVIPIDPSYDWARTLVKTSLDYAKKFPNSDFVGLSINASGEANEIPIDEFIQGAEIPSSALPKLQEAKAQGISSIRVVSKLSEAVSCDLVTEAGAGGKILQMLEMEKKPMGKSKVKESEMKKEKHESKEAHEDGMMMKKESEHEADTEHADEEQDKALFAKMIQQYLGEEHSEDQEAHEMAKQAYEACQADGMEAEEAYEAAGKHLKLSKAIGEKMAQKQGKKENAEVDECGEAEECDDEDADAKKMPPKKETEGHKESNLKLRKQVIQLSAENARLKESLKKFELKEYLEKKLVESKKPVAVTKKFREALGSPKSKEQIDHSYKLFMAAYQSATEDADGFDFAFTEKTGFKESDSGAAGSFEDCLN